MKITIGIFLVLTGIALFVLAAMIVISGDAGFLLNWSKT